MPDTLLKEARDMLRRLEWVGAALDSDWDSPYCPVCKGWHHRAASNAKGLDVRLGHRASCALADLLRRMTP